jgi:hypothetical protein
MAAADESTWITHRLGRARISLPPDLELQSAAFMVRGVQLWELAPPREGATAGALDALHRARTARLLDGEAWRRTVLRPLALGPLVRAFVVEERERAQSAEAVVATEAGLLRLEHVGRGLGADALVRPLREVMAAYRRCTDADLRRPGERAPFFLRRGVVALPFDRREGEATGAHWRSAEGEATLMVDVAEGARPESSADRARAALGGGARTVSFEWRSPARRRHDLQAQICLEGPAADAAALAQTWGCMLRWFELDGAAP